MSAQSSPSQVCASPEILADQVAIVFGGSGGIGRALAGELANRGCRVATTSRRQCSGAMEQSDESSIVRHRCDVRRAEDVEAAVEGVLDRWGRLDIVINSAGIGSGSKTGVVPAPLWRIDEEEWQEVLDTNLRGMFLVARAAARRMRRQGWGQIMNISSARGAKRGRPFAAPYCAAKMAARAMFESLADELRPAGVRVWSLLPDAVATELIANTKLAPRGSMRPAALAAAIVRLLSLPMDAELENPLIAPLKFADGGTR